MRDMDGFKLYNQLRKVYPDIKILFLTAGEKHRNILGKEVSQGSIAIQTNTYSRPVKRSESKIVCSVIH
jgi:CheY-like chemotaxis protein